MPAYQVRIKEIHTQVIDVIADNKQAALAAAEEVLSTGINQDGSDLANATEYWCTLDKEDWNVWVNE